MTRPAKREDAPPVDFIREGLILALWRAQHDTIEIAQRLGLREWRVHNLLLHLREAGR